MIPVLWLAGPPGVGKTAVGWEIYRSLQPTEADVAYVDVDQLGICYPALPGDPARHGLKARNVAALRANFAAAGARGLVVSGVADAQAGPDIAAMGGAPVAVVRLRADPEPLRARLSERDGRSALVDAALEEAKALDHSGFADRCVDTTGLSVGEAASRVLAEVGAWPPAGAEPASSPVAVVAPAELTGDILWVFGTSGVGKSTIGFHAYLDLLRAGRTAAYVDIVQLGLFPGSDDAALRARDLSAIWANFHAVGARLGIVTGLVWSPTEARRYERALPGVRFSWRRLRVGEAELKRRILSRGAGGSWAEPGDALKGRSRDELLHLAEGAIGLAGALERDGVGVPIDADGLDVEAAAARLLADWPAWT